MGGRYANIYTTIFTIHRVLGFLIIRSLPYFVYVQYKTVKAATVTSPRHMEGSNKDKKIIQVSTSAVSFKTQV